LIAASVCRTSSISKPLGASMRRALAEMTPVVSVRSRPNGLPIATVGSPTSTSFDVPSASGSRSSPFGSTRSSARSVDGSMPRRRARAVLPFWKRTEIAVAFSTTWALVSSEPSSSMTKPVPVDSPRCSVGKTSNGDSETCTTSARMNTTPGASRS
jgi:hypothetical protein